KVGSLEKMNMLRSESRVLNDEARYKAGLQVLHIMLSNMKKLDFATSLATSVERAQSLTNPMNNGDFVSEIRQLTGSNLGDKNRSIEANPLLSNPYVSLAWGIGSLLVSKFSSQKKAEMFNRFSCVIDIGTRTDTDLKIIRSDLSALQQRMGA